MADQPTSEKEFRKAGQRAEAEEARLGQELAQKEARFWASAYGQARSAKLAGDRYFQIELAIDSTEQSPMARTVVDGKGQPHRYNGQGTVLGNIEKEGWELIHADFMFREIGQASRDKLVRSGQNISTWGMTIGVYLFRATEDAPRTDEDWRSW